MVNWVELGGAKVSTKDNEEQKLVSPEDRWAKDLNVDVQNLNASGPGIPSGLSEAIAAGENTFVEGSNVVPFAQPDPTISEQASDASRAFPSGFNDWLASAAGFLPQVRQELFKLTGIPLPENELIKDVLFGPSKDRIWRAFNQLGIEKYEPKTGAGRIAQSAGWEAGMTLPFMLMGGSSAIARSASFTPKPTATTQIVKQEVLRPFIESPGRTAIVEISAGLGAGTGGQISQEVFGETLAADIVGQFFGGTTVGGISQRMLRAGSGVTEATSLMSDGKLPDGRLVGRTAEETAQEEASTIFLLEEKLGAQSLADDFVDVNADAGLGPLFGEGEVVTEFTKQLDLQYPKLDPISRKAQIDYVQKRIANAGREVKATTKKTPRQATSQELDQFLEDSYKASSAPQKLLSKERFEALAVSGRRKIVDRSANLAKQTLAAGGEYGRRAIQRFNMAKGGTAYAGFRFRSARKDIFGGLSSREQGGFPSAKQDFNSYITMLRGMEAQMLQTKKGEAAFLQLKGKQIPPEAYRQSIRNMESRLGPTMTQDFRRRAARYFGEMQTNVSRLEEEGLITGAEGVTLRSIVYSPKQFVDNIDPVVEIKSASGGAINVRSSGIQQMKGGGEGFIDMSVEDLLAQVTVRTENRIFRNRAAASFHEYALKQPDNGVVSLKRPKTDHNKKEWIQLSARVEGKTVKYFMEPTAADEFINNHAQEVTHRFLANVTGVRFGKALITGANPGIAPILFLRDMSFAIQTTGQYNRYVKPVGYGQMAGDIATVAKDSWTRTGRFEAYLKEGGGMNFLTHQGRVVDETTLTGRFQDTMHVLGYINETAEILTRLAIRERALKNGMSAEDATFAARDYMDFAQGGEWAKSADSVVMYANAAVLGWRNTMRSAKKDPKAFAAGYANSMAFFGALYWYNFQTNPEATRSLSSSQKMNGAYLTTPMSRIDGKQNVRYGVLKLPVEHSMLPAKVLVDAIMDKMLLDKDPDVATMDFLKAAANSASVGSLDSPVASMFKAFGNLDTWTNDKIWRGVDVPFGMEYKEFPDKPTSDMARDFSSALQMVPGLASQPIVSPERLATAMSKTGARGNFYTETFAGAYGAIRQVGPEVDQSWQANVRLVPGVNKFFRETHPLSVQIEDIQRMEREANAPMFKARQQIQQELSLLYSGQAGAKSVKEIRTQALELDQSGALGPKGMQSKQLAEYVSKADRISKIYASYGEKLPPGTPSKSQVLSVMNVPAEVQARIVYDWYRDAAEDEVNGPARRRAMRQITNVVRIFGREKFVRQLRDIENEEGKLQR